MKKSQSFLFVISVLVGMVLVSPAFAGSKKKVAPPVQHPPVISSVTANSVTVTENNASKTLSINQFTEITVNGQRATAADLKPGMTVSVTLGTDATKASRINATGK